MNPFYDGLALVEKQNKYGYINTKGEQVINLIYESAHDFKQGLGLVRQNDKAGFIDNTGKIVLPLRYDFIKYNPMFGSITVEKNNKHGLVDKTGAILVPPIYDDIHHVSDNIMIVKQNEKYGLINTNAQKITAIEYDQIDGGWDGDKTLIKNGDNSFYLDGQGRRLEKPFD